MKLRKILNIPSSKHKKLIQSELNIINKLIHNHQLEKVRQCIKSNYSTDFNCLKCGNSSEDTIVDKIFDVSGGRYRTSTEPVNHCNECGNEWKKGTLSASAIFRTIRSWSGLISEDNYIPSGLEELSAEAIKKSFSLFDITVSLRLFRKKFYSVYDREL